MADERRRHPGIADHRFSLRKRKVTFLEERDKLIAWKVMERLLNKRMKRQPDAVGNPAYPSLPMFKVLLLQRWHDLSDKAVEEGLTDRLSFVRFAWRAASQDLVLAVPGKHVE